MKSAGRRAVLVIEQLNVLTVLLAMWFAWRCQAIYFVSCARWLQASLVQSILKRLIALRRLRYEDFPGTYYEVQLTVADSVNDRLYDWARNGGARACVAFLRWFEPHELVEVALRRALDAYTEDRVKTFVFLRELVKLHGRLVFLPRDNVDLRFAVPESIARALAVTPVPRAMRFVNGVRARLKPIAAIGYATFHACALVMQRGVVRAMPSPRRWRVGFDIYDKGITWKRPYHEFFLYDDRALTPDAVLYVVRHRLADQRTRAYFATNRIPFVEAGTIPIPLDYLMLRIIRGFWAGVLRVAMRQLVERETGSFLSATMWVALALIKAELLERAYQTDVFVARDEYSMAHIIRTLIHDKRGGRTIGFGHGDDTLPAIANSYQCCHVFCFPGEFHRVLLARNTRFSRETRVIGAGLYGLDETYVVSETGMNPATYARLRATKKLVGVFASSFEDDFCITREITLRFYRAAFDIVEKCPNTVVVVRPKGDEFRDPEFARLLLAAGPNVVLEEQVATYQLLPVLDLVVCIASSTVGLEGFMAGRPVIYYDESHFEAHPYARYDPFLVARSPEALIDRVRRVLEEGEYLDPQVQEFIRRHHGLAFDGKVTERFRRVVYEALAQTQRCEDAAESS